MSGDSENADKQAPIIRQPNAFETHELREVLINAVKTNKFPLDPKTCGVGSAEFTADDGAVVRYEVNVATLRTWVEQSFSDKISDSLEAKPPSSLFLDLFMNPEDANDANINLLEIYAKIWVPRHGVRWAKRIYYGQIARILIGTAFDAIIGRWEKIAKAVRLIG